MRSYEDVHAERIEKLKAKFIRQKRNVERGRHPNYSNDSDPLTVQNLRCFVTSNSAGRVITRLWSNDDPGPPYVELDLRRDREALSMMNQHPTAVRIDPLTAIPSLRPKVRMTVNDPVFAVDDETTPLEIMVIGLPDDVDGAWVSINGQRHLITTGVPLGIVARRPGQYVVRFDDSRFWCDEPVILCQAYRPEEIAEFTPRGEPGNVG